jgi:hypothetical protein
VAAPFLSTLDALPTVQHLELDCGHVPQPERPRETHEAMTRFLVSGSIDD